jgi:hypothetical protein
VAKDRISPGLTFSMFVAAVSLGLMTICWNLWRPVMTAAELLAHVSACLCGLWTLPCYLLTRYRPALAAKPKSQDLISVLEIGAITTGLFTVILMVYVAVFEAIFRTLLSHYEATPHIHVWPSGLLDLALVAFALLLSWRYSGNKELVTALFWTMVIAALWLAFQTPAFRADSQGRIVATHWAAIFITLTSLVIGTFVVVTAWARKRRRLRAWPNELWILSEPPIDWPGLRYSAGIMCVVILLLGCAEVVVPLTAPAALIAGAAAVALAGRQWDENLADVGLALITLGVVAAIVLLFPALPAYWTPAAWAEVFNRALLGLAVMAAIWYWLSAVWSQQLDQGRAWTTTGHLVRAAQRIGYLLSALAVLVSFQLAFWPNLPYGYADADAWRWAWGLTANGLLVLALAFITRQTQRPTNGWLLLFAVASTVVFAVIRTPQGLLGRTWARDWPTVLAVTGGLLVVVSAAVSRTKHWQALFEPIYLAGTAIAPLVAMGGIFLGDPQRLPQWIPAATFACLTVIYWLAAVLPGPVTFKAVSVLCAALTFWKLQGVELQGTKHWLHIAPAFNYAMLISISAALWAWVVLQRGPNRLASVVKWGGGILAVLVILAGWLVSRAGP